jgi:hypothetical protein
MLSTTPRNFNQCAEWTPAAAQLVPSDLLRIAEHSRGVKVFIYDLAAAGFQPDLSVTDASSGACRCLPYAGQTEVTAPGFPTDFCNEGLGRLQRHLRFTAAYQGNYWANHHGGESVAMLVHSRLSRSYRRRALIC